MKRSEEMGEREGERDNALRLDVLKVGRVPEGRVLGVQLLHPQVQVRVLCIFGNVQRVRVRVGEGRGGTDVLADRADVALEVGDVC